LSNGALSIGVEGGDLDAVLQMTQRFGRRARSRAHAYMRLITNRQCLLLRKIVWYKPARLRKETTLLWVQAVPPLRMALRLIVRLRLCRLGIILSIFPSINLDTQEVTLNVRPTLSRQVDQVENASTRLAAKALNDTTLQSFIPIVEVREIDSVMKIKSGGVMIIGGLMEDTGTSEDRRYSWCERNSVAGHAFKVPRSEISSKRELIILIKATVVNSSGSMTPIHRSIFKKYTTDPRPI